MSSENSNIRYAGQNSAIAKECLLRLVQEELEQLNREITETNAQIAALEEDIEITESFAGTMRQAEMLESFFALGGASLDTLAQETDALKDRKEKADLEIRSLPALNKLREKKQIQEKRRLALEYVAGKGYARDFKKSLEDFRTTKEDLMKIPAFIMIADYCDGNTLEVFRNFLQSPGYKNLSQEERYCVDGDMIYILMWHVKEEKRRWKQWLELPIMWDKDYYTGQMNERILSVYQLKEKGLLSLEVMHMLLPETMEELYPYFEKVMWNAEAEQIMRPIVIDRFNRVFIKQYEKASSEAAQVLERLKKWREEEVFAPYREVVEKYLYGINGHGGAIPQFIDCIKEALIKRYRHLLQDPSVPEEVCRLKRAELVEELADWYLEKNKEQHIRDWDLDPEKIADRQNLDSIQEPIQKRLHAVQEAQREADRQEEVLQAKKQREERANADKRLSNWIKERFSFIDLILVLIGATDFMLWGVCLLICCINVGSRSICRSLEKENKARTISMWCGLGNTVMIVFLAMGVSVIYHLMGGFSVISSGDTIFQVIYALISGTELPNVAARTDIDIVSFLISESFSAAFCYAIGYPIGKLRLKRKKGKNVGK